MGKRNDVPWDEWHKQPPLSVRLRNADQEWITEHRAELAEQLHCQTGFSSIISAMVHDYRVRHDATAGSASPAEDAMQSAEDASVDDATASGATAK